MIEQSANSEPLLATSSRTPHEQRVIGVLTEAHDGLALSAILEVSGGTLTDTSRALTALEAQGRVHFKGGRWTLGYWLAPQFDRADRSQLQVTATSSTSAAARRSHREDRAAEPTGPGRGEDDVSSDERAQATLVAARAVAKGEQRLSDRQQATGDREQATLDRRQTQLDRDTASGCADLGSVAQQEQIRKAQALCSANQAWLDNAQRVRDERDLLLDDRQARQHLAVRSDPEGALALASWENELAIARAEALSARADETVRRATAAQHRARAALERHRAARCN